MATAELDTDQKKRKHGLKLDGALQTAAVIQMWQQNSFLPHGATPRVRHKWPWRYGAIFYPP